MVELLWRLARAYFHVAAAAAADSAGAACRGSGHVPSGRAGRRRQGRRRLAGGYTDANALSVAVTTNKAFALLGYVHPALIVDVATNRAGAARACRDTVREAARRVGVGVGGVEGGSV